LTEGSEVCILPFSNAGWSSGSSSGSNCQLTNEHNDVFIGYRSEIHIVEADKRQRKPQSAQYRDAWELIVQWAAREETCV
jgi:hypothetical protein